MVEHAVIYTVVVVPHGQPRNLLLIAHLDRFLLNLNSELCDAILTRAFELAVHSSGTVTDPFLRVLHVRNCESKESGLARLT